MLKYYLSRYMDLKKCAEIKRSATCDECGGDLEGQHVTDFNLLSVREYLRCPRCHEEPLVLEYLLH